MPPDQLDHLVAALAAGFGLAVVGLLNLFAARSGLIFRATATTLTCSAAVTVIVLWSGTLAAAGTVGLVLAGGLAAYGALGSRRCRAAAAWVAARAARPAGRAGLVAAAGLAVVAAGVARFEAAEREQTARDDLLMDLAGGAESQAVIGEHVPAVTDYGSRVLLGGVTAPRDREALNATEDMYLRNNAFALSLIRREPADDRCNCHGWVFTAGRYHVPGGTVEQILRDNGYQPTTAPRPGDLVVYRQGGKVVHTAVVRYVTGGMPVLVEGKWGVLGVFLHPVDKSCYGTEYTYHRSPRAGHVLAGLGSGGVQRPLAGG